MTSNIPNIHITIGRFKNPRRQKRKASLITATPYI